MLRIGITGQSGFIGTYLYNTLGLYPNDFERIPFEDIFFQSETALNEFVCSCDVIVHLAALNRHNDSGTIYQTNLKLVNQIIEACLKTSSKPHIIFSSSTQEERDNPYGRSKFEGRKLFESWAQSQGSQFTGLIIPNVYGPYGNPYFNSVVATFCHQLTHGEQPRIEVDAIMKLIYVGELVQKIMDLVKINSLKPSLSSFINEIYIDHTVQIKVSELLKKLEMFKKDYFDKAIIPDLSESFDRNLYNTFLGFVDHSSFFPYFLDLKTDNRGSFVETVKLNSGGQVSFSTTKPGVTRGNHFHTRKAERFAVIKGKAIIEIRRIGTDKKLIFELDGSKPSFVDMPVWFTHNITNVGNEDLFTLFWISEHFDEKDPDTYFEQV